MFPVLPLVLLAGGVATIGYGALSQPSGAAGSRKALPPPGPAPAPSGGMPPEIRVLFQQLMTTGRDPIAMRQVADRLDQLGFPGEATELRARADQLVPVVSPAKAAVPQVQPPPSPVPLPVPPQPSRIVIMASVNTASDPLNIRSAPSTSAPIIGTAPKGALVQVISPGSDPAWMQIAYNGKTGYASAQYLKLPDGGGGPLPNILPPTPTPAAQLTATVSTVSTPLNIRSTPSASGALVGTAPKGSTVKVLNPMAKGPDSAAPMGWAQIQYGTITGYSSLQYLTMNAPMPPSVSGFVVGGVDHGEKPKPLRCMAPSGCRVRSEPNATSLSRALVASGEVVHGLKVAPGPKAEANSPGPGGWVMVKYRGIIGWVPAEWFVPVGHRHHDQKR